MTDEYCLPGLLGAEELKLAIKALGLAPGTERLTTMQLKAWGLVRDTYLGNLSDHCSRVSDRALAAAPPTVVTKRSMSKYRR